MFFYDAECALCNGFVKLLLRNNDTIKFSALDSDVSKFVIGQNLPSKVSAPTDTSVLYKNGRLYFEYECVLESLDLCPLLGTETKLLRLLNKLIGNKLSNKLYRLVSNNRYYLSNKMLRLLYRLPLLFRLLVYKIPLIGLFMEVCTNDICELENPKYKDRFI